DRSVDAGLVRPVGALPVDRQRWADLLRLRLGVAPVGGRVPGGLPGAHRRPPAAAGDHPAALAAVPRRVRGGPHQDARRQVLAAADLPRLPHRTPPDATPPTL